jgi:hypothetical protein
MESPSLLFEIIGAHASRTIEQVMLECGEHHKLGNEEELAKIQQRVFNQYVNTGGHYHEFLRKIEVKAMKKDQFFSRLTMALFGGAALIAPMLIMILHQSKLTSLLTTSLFVVVVAVTLAWWMEDATSKDIVGATAAYAAVLVVFVGTGTPTTG